jgi:hypothetical protein
MTLLPAYFSAAGDDCADHCAHGHEHPPPGGKSRVPVDLNRHHGPDQRSRKLEVKMGGVQPPGGRDQEMTKQFGIKVLACLIAALFITITVPASARIGDAPNSGRCKSGAEVRDLKSCKENGGKR